MRVIDRAVQYNEHGVPVELITLEIPLAHDIYETPDELLNFLERVRKEKFMDKLIKNDAELI